MSYLSANFYDEYIYNPEQKKLLLKTYSELFEILRDYVEQIDNNLKLNTVLAYKKIAFQGIDISKIIFNSEINFGIKKADWDEMLLDEKINVLDSYGYYITLTSKITVNDQKISLDKFDVINFELYDTRKKVLIPNVDYAFRDNKIYLLKEIDIQDIKRSKKIIMRNAFIDYSVTNNTLGLFLDMPYNRTVTSIDYNELFKSFMNTAVNGPYMDYIHDFLSLNRSIKGLQIIDKYNSETAMNGIYADYWSDNNYVFGSFSPFDFLIIVPNDLSNQAEKRNYIRNFFNKIKPEESNFKMGAAINVIEDQCPINSSRHEITILKQISPRYDKEYCFDDDSIYFDQYEDWAEMFKGE